MLSFADVLAAWGSFVLVRDDLAAATRVIYCRVVRHLANWPGAEQPIDALDLRGYPAHRPGIAPRTLALELRVARAACNWARQSGLASTAIVQFPRVRVDPNDYRCNHRTPTADEVAAVLRHMPDDDWRLVVRLLLGTGGRIGEVLQLRVADLDVPGARLGLGRHAGARKTGMRWFPLGQAILRILRVRPGDRGDLLFPFSSVAHPIQGLQHRLSAACVRGGVPPFSPHGLRRLFVTRLLRAGVSAGVAASLTGHSIPVMLRYYQQVTDGDRRVAVVRARVWSFSEES